jgi:flavodoxin I
MVSLLALVLAISIANGADAFAVAPKSRSASSLGMSIGIYYSTTTGNAEIVAGYIAEAARIGAFEDIGDATKDDDRDSLIVGAPTWHTGADEQRSGTPWDEWLYDTLPELDLAIKKIAIFGVGDQEGYGDNYCDAARELFDLFTAKSCRLMCDEDNQYDLSEGRAQAWIKQDCLNLVEQSKCDNRSESG